MKRGYLSTDGAARGNPGPAGAGFVVFGSDRKVIFEGHEYLGELTNNQAEYNALRLGLEKVIELGFEEIEVRMDSELIVRQVNGEYKVKNSGLKPYFKEVTVLLSRLNSYKVVHVPREENKKADKLANKAIDDAF